MIWKKSRPLMFYNFNYDFIDLQIRFILWIFIQKFFQPMQALDRSHTIFQFIFIDQKISVGVTVVFEWFDHYSIEFLPFFFINIAITILIDNLKHLLNIILSQIHIAESLDPVLHVWFWITIWIRKRLRVIQTDGQMR